jgi:hypothetical protein
MASLVADQGSVTEKSRYAVYMVAGIMSRKRVVAEMVVLSSDAARVVRFVGFVIVLRNLSPGDSQK